MGGLNLMILPKECILRQASDVYDTTRLRDIWSIRKLVFSAKLDPTQLRWQQFWLIECSGQIVACGQLRDFTDAQELGSLVVVPSWRRQGLGTYLVQHLIQQASKPLYLECLGTKLVDFYTSLGFKTIFWQELPTSLQAKFALSQLGKTILRLPVTFMKY
jgi:amino-acid N-acetyltransferase